MANQTWRVVDKVIEDSQSGLRLKVELTHGGMQHHTNSEDEGYSPTTWGRIAILPNEGESVKDMAARIGATETYESYVIKMRGRDRADTDIRIHGIGQGVHINTQVGLVGLWEPEGIVSELDQRLSEKGFDLGFNAALEIRQFLESNLTREALHEAEAAYARTGGKSAGEVGR